jgi:hypothetical protein
MKKMFGGLLIAATVLTPIAPAAAQASGERMQLAQRGDRAIAAAPKCDRGNPRGPEARPERNSSVAKCAQSSVSEMRATARRAASSVAIDRAAPERQQQQPCNDAQRQRSGGSSSAVTTSGRRSAVAAASGRAAPDPGRQRDYTTATTTAASTAGGTATATARSIGGTTATTTTASIAAMTAIATATSTAAGIATTTIASTSATGGTTATATARSTGGTTATTTTASTGAIATAATIAGTGRTIGGTATWRERPPLRLARPIASATAATTACRRYYNAVPRLPLHAVQHRVLAWVRYSMAARATGSTIPGYYRLPPAYDGYALDPLLQRRAPGRHVQRARSIDVIYDFFW